MTIPGAPVIQGTTDENGNVRITAAHIAALNRHNQLMVQESRNITVASDDAKEFFNITQAYLIRLEADVGMDIKRQADEVKKLAYITRALAIGGL